MLRICLFGLSKRRKQPERYTPFFSPHTSAKHPRPPLGALGPHLITPSSSNPKKIQIPIHPDLHWHFLSLDLFNNPVGCLTSLAVFQAKALQNCVF
jgi:hypothetical protein